MELRQMRHFIAVAEHENFTRAAQSMHIVQSALSTSIKQLEEELGTPLLSAPLASAPNHGRESVSRLRQNHRRLCRKSVAGSGGDRGAQDRNPVDWHGAKRAAVYRSAAITGNLYSSLSGF